MMDPLGAIHPFTPTHVLATWPTALALLEPPILCNASPKIGETEAEELALLLRRNEGYLGIRNLIRRTVLTNILVNQDFIYSLVMQQAKYSSCLSVSCVQTIRLAGPRGRYICRPEIKIVCESTPRM